MTLAYHSCYRVARRVSTRSMIWYMMVFTIVHRFSLLTPTQAKCARRHLTSGFGIARDISCTLGKVPLGE
jgi:hypothetical protein